MKYLLFLSLLLTFNVWSKTNVNFSDALNDDLEAEIKKDDFKYKKKAFRGPASVNEKKTPEPVIKEVPKVDKKDRQIGPNNW